MELPVLPDAPEGRRHNQSTGNGEQTKTLYWLKNHLWVSYMRKDSVITQVVGMNAATLMAKLEDGNLDHIHHRRLRVHLVKVQEKHSEACLRRKKKPLVADAVGSDFLLGEVPKKKSELVLVACPTLLMGYSCVECTERMAKHNVVDHLAGHIATLTKRLHELEEEVGRMKNGGREVVDLGE